MMTPGDLHELALLLRTRRLAALGTLHDGQPHVSMALYAPAPDLAAFYLHLSRLALHTRDLHANPACGLMVSEPDTETRNPLTLGRISLQGQASLLAEDAPEFGAAKAAYLARFPFAAINFTLPDFGLFKLTPSSARYVAGFGRIFDLSVEDLRQAGALSVE